MTKDEIIATLNQDDDALKGADVNEPLDLSTSTQPTATEPVTLRIGDHEVTGSSPEELQKGVDDYLASLDNAADPIVDPTALQAALSAPVTASKKEEPPKEPLPAFSAEAWQKQVLDDPLGAHRYAMQHSGYDEKIERLASLANDLEALRNENQQQAAAVFLSTTADFPEENLQAAALVRSVAEQLEGGVTLPNLRASWEHLKKLNAVVPRAPVTAEPAKPKLRSSQSSSDDSGTTKEQRTLAQFITLLEEKGVEAAQEYADRVGLSSEGSLSLLNGSLPNN